ncbi:hypothetical protein FB384_004228 [Prauserella sediminis]|uniref:Uncharacterized protein n=1 Tax=Prauserella sediminis TaxID=577680 RepID=A0A839XZY3_9PSEU|nr:hypothetical protein [Prauserella sediminis]MBB3665275.1 hypothetical protein [Prauserella sediminis]
MTEPIEGRLGQVGVHDSGALVGVDLNESAMRTMRADSIARYMVAAINRAQDNATTQGSRWR